MERDFLFHITTRQKRIGYSPICTRSKRRIWKGMTWPWLRKTIPHHYWCKSEMGFDEFAMMLDSRLPCFIVRSKMPMLAPESYVTGRIGLQALLILLTWQTATSGKKKKVAHGVSLFLAGPAGSHALCTIKWLRQGCLSNECIKEKDFWETLGHWIFELTSFRV